MPAMPPQPSLTFVKVKFLDPERILAGLTEIAGSLILNNQNIKGIYLFGSLTRRKVVPGSDADILILLKKDARRMIDRIPEFHKHFLTSSVPTDIFPYTEAEIRNLLNENNSFIRSIWKEKIVLAEQ